VTGWAWAAPEEGTKARVKGPGRPAREGVRRVQVQVPAPGEGAPVLAPELA